MTSQIQLTQGALRIIMTGGEVKDPIMQVLAIKNAPNKNQPDRERYRLMLSDGEFFISYAILSLPKSSDGKSAQVPDNTIIKMTHYLTSLINNETSGERRIVVILGMEVLVDGTGIKKIGDPGSYCDMNGNAGESSLAISASKQTQPIANLMLPSGAAQNNGCNEFVLKPISNLSPFFVKWLIKARVINKSSIRTWSSSNGEGKLFSIDLLDNSGEIRATIFQDLVDKYYQMIEVDKVYLISKGKLRIANKQFTSIKNDFEITFTNDTFIEECHDDTNSVPKVQYDFVRIDSIASKTVGTFVDVISVCKSTSDIVSINSKSTGRILKKREVTLVDTSNFAICLTLWNNDAENFDGSLNPVVLVKGAKLGEFAGSKNLSLIGGSQMRINPNMPEAHDLREWFDMGGCQADVSNISGRAGGLIMGTPWMNLKQVRQDGLGSKDTDEYFQVLGTVLFIRSENVLYKACPEENCNKKVIDLSNGMYKCEKCNKEYKYFDYRLLLQMNVGDWSGSYWITVFNADAEFILGLTARELGEANAADDGAVASVTANAHFKQFVFKCRARTEIYNDESRVKIVAVKVSLVNYKEHNAYLVERIKSLTDK